MIRCIKFVNEDYKSPGNYGKLDYSNFCTWIEEPDYDHPSLGQCAKGIHVIPVCDEMSSECVVFSDKCIILDVDESDVIWQQNNNKMRVKKALIIKELTREDSEFQFIRKDPEYAYLYACHVDKSPRDDTRKSACKDPECAYSYARDVDKSPRDDTRKSACKDPTCAYWYANYVDDKEAS